MSLVSSNSVPAHRRTNLVPVLIALCLAWLSSSMNTTEPDRAAPAHVGAASQGAVALPEDGHVLRGVFASSAGDRQARKYHSAFQNSDSTGMLGFWMLVSLCGLLLGAALAPPALQRLWRHLSMRRSDQARRQG